MYGAENVFDFSLGNPNVPAPEGVKNAILSILDEEDPLMVHGYMSNSGYEDVRGSHRGLSQSALFTSTRTKTS